MLVGSISDFFWCQTINVFGRCLENSIFPTTYHFCWNWLKTMIEILGPKSFLFYPHVTINTQYLCQRSNLDKNCVCVCVCLCVCVSVCDTWMASALIKIFLLISNFWKIVKQLCWNFRKSAETKIMHSSLLGPR